MKVQRLRVTFSRGQEVKYITHLDLMRFWERALRRAGLALAYSEGFSPHPQISLAAPLPVGVTSSGELMDIYLTEQVSLRHFLCVIGHELPRGLSVTGVQEVDMTLPSIQSQMRAAEYRVAMPLEADVSELAERVAELLARPSVPWQHQREKDVRSYDLRPLILDLSAEQESEGATLRMRLLADNSAAGRPDQVLLALGLPGLSIERTALILASGEAEEAVAGAEDRRLETDE